ncbi:DUF3515 domain-containing protein [Nocardioides sp.]|uniref:DUF3515 domain-containing protein n=1 Tax=Nocardioides sp. TaxID=35761 RepID=UPI002B26C42C|nr:DUF3515 domain-containing protein [Nocardioides sp.]
MVAPLVTAVPLVLLLAACSGGPVSVATPDLDGSDRAACEALVADLPDTLADELPREIEPVDALGAAYGDPAIVVRCGVAVPANFNQASSSCEVANGVGWFVAPEEFIDQDADVTLTAAGYRPVVEVRVPGGYRPDGPAAAIAQLAAAIDEHLTLVENCN